MSSSPAASYTASTVPGPRLFPSTTYRSNRFSCKKRTSPVFPGCPPSNFHVRLPESCSHSSSHSEAPPNHSHRRSRPPRPPPVPSSGSASSFPPPWGRLQHICPAAYIVLRDSLIAGGNLRTLIHHPDRLRPHFPPCCFLISTIFPALFSCPTPALDRSKLPLKAEPLSFPSSPSDTIRIRSRRSVVFPHLGGAIRSVFRILPVPGSVKIDRIFAAHPII